MNCICIIIIIFMIYFLFIENKEECKNETKNDSNNNNKYSEYVNNNIENDVDIENLLSGIKLKFNKGKNKINFNVINHPLEQELGIKINIKPLLNLIFKNINYKFIEILNIDKFTIDNQVLLKIHTNILIDNNNYNIFIKLVSERDEQFELFYYEDLCEKNFLLELTISDYDVNKKHMTINEYLKNDKENRLKTSKMNLLPNIKYAPIGKYLKS